MSTTWLPALAGLLFFGMGFYQLFAPLDTLWASQQRYWQVRGIAAERTELWEEGTRRSGYFFLAFGACFLLLAGILNSPSVSPPMAGVTVNGRALTQKEWDACHHDGGTCAAQYALTQGR